MSTEKERESFSLPGAEGRIIIHDDSEDFEIIENQLFDNSRWSLIYHCVVKRKSDGKFFKTRYSVGATESQDERAYEYEDAEFEEVFPVEVTKIEYK